MYEWTTRSDLELQLKFKKEDVVICRRCDMLDTMKNHTITLGTGGGQLDESHRPHNKI